MQVKEQLGTEKVNLARKLFSKKLGDYFLTRFALYRYLGIKDLEFERYLLEGELPDYLWDEKVERFEELRVKYEKPLRRKLKLVRHSVQFDILLKKLKEDW